MLKHIPLGLIALAVLTTALFGMPDPANAIGNDLAVQMMAPGLAAAGGFGMIFSDQLKFSTDQDLAQIAGTYNSTNVINTGTPGTVFGHAAALGRDVGKGIPVNVLVQIVEAFTSGGAATLQFQIETADNEAFSTNNEVIAESRAYALAELVAGKQFEVQYLPNDCRQYLRVNYVIGTATTTAGKCTSGIVHGVQTNDNQG